MDVQARAIERATAQGYHPIESTSNVDFPPVQVDWVYDRDGNKISGYQRIHRDDSGDTLAIHTSTYEMRPYADSFRQLEESIRQSDLDRRDLMVKTEFSHNGGRCFRSYLFPHIAIEPEHDDSISLQILGFDSYDGSYSTSLAAGGYRHICLNGCFFGRTIQQLKVRHTTGAAARFINGLEKVMAAAETFTAMAPRLRAWKQVELSVMDFRDTIESGLPQCTERLRDYLVARYATNAEEQTLYGAWNLATAWATKEGGSAQSRVDRDRRVAGLIESKGWLRLEQA